MTVDSFVSLRGSVGVYTVQLVAYDSAGGGNAFLFSLPVDASFHGALSGPDVAAIGTSADVVQRS